MKKIFIPVLILCVLVSLSCGKKADDTGKDKKPAEKINTSDFFKAVKDNDLPKVKDMLGKDQTLAKAIDSSQSLDENALNIAAFGGKKELSELLIKNGADVNFKDVYGITALHSAARTNHPDIIELLIKNKADVNIKNKSDETPLYYASEFNNPDCVKILLTNNADKNAKSTSGKAALEIAKDKKNDKGLDLLK